MKQQAEELLRVDALGRVWTTPDRREWLVDEFKRSGVAGAEFARIVGIKYSTFANWMQRRRRAMGGYPAPGKAGIAAGTKRRAASPEPRFVEAQIEQGAGIRTMFGFSQPNGGRWHYSC